MGIVMSSGNSTRLIGEKFDVEEQINDIAQEISQLQNLGTILADGIVSPEEFDGIDYNNLPIIADFQNQTARRMNKELPSAFTFYKRQYAPQEHAQLKEYLSKSFLAEAGRIEEKKLAAREKVLTQKKDKLEKRLKMIEAQIQSNDQLFNASVKTFAPKFAGGGQQ